MRVLITGYEPAYGIKKTPSGEIAKAFADGSTFLNNVETFGVVLPQSFAYQSERLISELGVIRPEFLFILGSTFKHGKVRLEEFALNVIDTKVGDNSKIPITNRMVNQRGPAALRSNVNIDGVMRKIEDPESVVRSYHAGTHVCNALYYDTLDYLSRFSPATKCLMIHVPFPVEYGIMDDPETGLSFPEISHIVRSIITSTIMTHAI